MSSQAAMVWNSLRPGEIATDAPLQREAGFQLFGSSHTPWTDPHSYPKWGDEAIGAACWIGLNPKWKRSFKGTLLRYRLQVLH